MIVVRHSDELREAILERRVAGDSVGFVPTMGMLHDGPALARAAARAPRTAASSCPASSTRASSRRWTSRRPAARATMPATWPCSSTRPPTSASCPTSARSIRRTTPRASSVEGLTRQLEGASRPGHLDGLTTVMLKLINLVGPARLYLGQRHAQQVVIVRRMLRDLFMNVELVICPTVREDDGLAMSSANARLGIEERHAATCLYQALTAAKDAYDAGERSAEVLRWRMTGRPLARAEGAGRLRQRRRCRHPGRAAARHRPGAGADRGRDRPDAADRQHAPRLGRGLGRPPRELAIQSTSAVGRGRPYDAPVTATAATHGRITLRVHGRPAGAHVRPPFALPS